MFNVNAAIAHEINKLRKILPAKGSEKLFNLRNVPSLTAGLRSLLKTVFGFPSWYVSSFSGHSLRRSGAQYLKFKGVSDDKIMEKCRWKSSSMLPLYLR